MLKCVVIADDLTGGNAAGVAFKKMNYEAYTVMKDGEMNSDIFSKYDCVVYPTYSKTVGEEVAYNRVRNVCKLLKSDKVRLYSKRTDSSLRGNIGREIDAMLDELGQDYIAIVAPCFPEFGKTVVGGYLLINGTPLHKTIVALDKELPVLESEVEVLLGGQSHYQVSALHMKDYSYGKYYLAEKMKQKVKEGSRILVFDCINQEDLERIADAVMISGLKVISVDPGVFTATLARKLVVEDEKRDKMKILAINGSLKANVKAQMEEVWLAKTTHNVFVHMKEFLEGEERRENEINRVVEEVLVECDQNDVFTITGDGIYPENHIDFIPYASLYQCTIDEMKERLNRGLAEIAYRIFKENKQFQGLYVGGGDTTVAVCNEFQTSGLHLVDEVLPFAAHSKFVGGEFDGLDIVTKGGSRGERDAINYCITYLKQKLHI